MRAGPYVSRFHARFESECETYDETTCSGEIFEGERAGYIGDDAEVASCEACCDAAEES